METGLWPDQGARPRVCACWVADDILALQMQAVTAQETVLTALPENARTELPRGEDLLSRGVATEQRLDALRTQVDVLVGQFAAVAAQQATEFAILAPVAGRVLDTPVSGDAVVLPGEAMAAIGGGALATHQGQRPSRQPLPRPIARVRVAQSADYVFALRLVPRPMAQSGSFGDASRSHFTDSVAALGLAYAQIGIGDVFAGDQERRADRGLFDPAGGFSSTTLTPSTR